MPCIWGLKTDLSNDHYVLQKVDKLCCFKIIYDNDRNDNIYENLSQESLFWTFVLGENNI